MAVALSEVLGDVAEGLPAHRGREEEVGQAGHQAQWSQGLGEVAPGASRSGGGHPEVRADTVLTHGPVAAAQGPADHPGFVPSEPAGLGQCGLSTVWGQAEQGLHQVQLVQGLAGIEAGAHPVHQDRGMDPAPGVGGLGQELAGPSLVDPGHQTAQAKLGEACGTRAWRVLRAAAVPGLTREPGGHQVEEAEGARPGPEALVPDSTRVLESMDQGGRQGLQLGGAPVAEAHDAAHEPLHLIVGLHRLQGVAHGLGQGLRLGDGHDGLGHAEDRHRDEGQRRREAVLEHPGDLQGCRHSSRPGQGRDALEELLGIEAWCLPFLLLRPHKGLQAGRQERGQGRGDLEEGVGHLLPGQEPLLEKPEMTGFLASIHRAERVASRRRVRSR